MGFAINEKKFFKDSVDKINKAKSWLEKTDKQNIWLIKKNPENTNSIGNVREVTASDIKENF